VLFLFSSCLHLLYCNVRDCSQSPLSRQFISLFLYSLIYRFLSLEGLLIHLLSLHSFTGILDFYRLLVTARPVPLLFIFHSMRRSLESSLESSGYAILQTSEAPISDLSEATVDLSLDRLLTQKQVEDFVRRPQIHLHVPDNLKSLMVDDWEEVTKNLKLVPLPSTTPVSQILDEYVSVEKANRTEGTADWDILEEVIVGLREYFNKSLGRVLLYRFERDQYVDIYQRTHAGSGDLIGKEMCEVYGGEHLLRLFSKCYHS
jgi:hypothetical protein